MDQMEAISQETKNSQNINIQYYWSTLFKDAHAYSRSSDTCQKSIGREKIVGVPLKPISIEQPSKQWGIYIINEINPHSSKKHRYIVTTTDYFTCSTEAIPLTKLNGEVVMIFLE